MKELIHVKNILKKFHMIKDMIISFLDIGLEKGGRIIM